MMDCACMFDRRLGATVLKQLQLIMQGRRLHDNVMVFGAPFLFP